MGKRKRYDWEKIETQFRANVLSVRQIAREHDIGESTIRNRAKTNGWVKDLSRDIIKRSKEKISTSDRYGIDTTEQIIEDAATEVADIVLSHRDDLRALRCLEVDLIDRVKADGKLPSKTEVCAMLAEIERKKNNGEPVDDIMIPDDVQELSIKDRAITINRITDARIKRIDADRKAYNMDGGREDETADMTESEIDAELKALEE